MSLTPEEQARYDQIKAWAAEDKDENGVPLDWFRFTDFVRYDPATGAIIESGHMSVAGIQAQAQATGGAYLKQAGSLDRHFVDLATPAVKPKTACPAALAGQSLSGLPQPCTIRITGPDGASTDYACTDPTADISFDYPGAYAVTVLSVPYLPGSFSITV